MVVIDTNDDVSEKIPFLLKKGVTAVGRYYSSAHGKRISASEAEAIAAAGLKLFMVFEDNGDPPLGGNAGSTDAKLALEQARAIGQPAGSAIYFAMEHLPNGYTSADLPGVKAYFQQIQAAFQGKYKIGVYSDGVVCDALLTSRLCDFAWLSASMGFQGSKAFYLSGRWSLAQQTPLDQNWSGLSVDTNEAKQTFGEFVPASLTAPEPAVSQQSPAAAPPRGSLGWKPDVPDHRDLPYSMRLGIEAPAVLPPSVDLRSNCPAVYQQGSLDSCTANAIAAAFEFLEIMSGRTSLDPSRLFIYYNERKLEDTTDSDSGAYLRDGIKCIATNGICSEANWPYDVAKFADAPPDAAFQAALTYKALSYFRLNSANIDELKGCLAAGFPFVFGFSVYDSFHDADSNGGLVSLPGDETLRGGHAVLAVGYDDAKQLFTVQNSWGTAVGDLGYYYMPYNYLTSNQLSDDFWTVRSVSGPSDPAAVAAAGGATTEPATPSAAMRLGLAPGAPGTFTVHRGKRYQATVTLNWLEQGFATKDVVEKKFEGFGFTNVNADQKTAGTWQVTGTWPGADTTEPIDPHLSNIIELS